MKFEDHLEQLRLKFVQELAERFMHIQALYRQFKHDDSQKADLRQALHRLVGVAGTFKAARISELARNLETHLAQAFIAYPEDEEKVVAILFNRLENAVVEYLAQQNETENFSAHKLILPKHDKTICLVDDDPLQAEQMALILREEGYQVVVHHALPEFSEFLNGQHPLPSLILMDIVFADSPDNGPGLIQQLRETVIDFPPVIFVSVLSDIQTRIQAIRAGGVEYLVKPVRQEILVGAVDKYLRKPLAYKILIVDDDEITAEYVATVIRQAGMQALTLLQPLRIFEVLEEFKPDLLILDIYMPECTGIELVQSIRQCCCYSMMPIIFLTSETQIDQELAALSSGGDEFVRKSDSHTYLLNKLESRLLRLRQIRELNRQLERAQARSDQLRKMQSDFLSYVVHELKTPLHVMLGFSDLLRMEPGLTLDQADMVGEIVRSGQAQLEMINELSERAKIVAGKLNLNIESFDIYTLLKESVNAVLLLSLKNDINLISDFDNHQIELIQADRRRVGQIIANLLTNAIKYNKEGGSVWVSAKNRSNGTVRITVKDNGIGIKAENLDSVFDAFERLNVHHANVEGTGIGLSICSQLVKLMGGSIGVESEFNVGSSFWVELPLADN